MTLLQTISVEKHSEEQSHQDSHDHKTIAHSGGALLLASAFGNGLNYAFAIFLARQLGAEEFGLYALALTIFNMVTLAVVLGMDTGTIKFVSQHLGEGQHAKARETLVATAWITFACGLIAAIGLGILAHPLAMIVYGKPELFITLLFFASAIPFGAVTIVLISSLQAFQTVRYTILIKYLWEPVAKFVFAGLFLWAGFRLLGVLASIVLTLAASTAIAGRSVLRVAFKGSDGYGIWNLQEAKKFLAYCFPLAISNLFGVVAPRSDILVLGYWATNEEVGIYLAAFQTAAIMSLVLGAFDTGLSPILSRAWSQQDKFRMKDSYQAVSRICITVSFPIFCSLVLFAGDILSIFGPGFIGGTAAVIILAVGQVFNNAMGSANTVLLMAGHSRLVMLNTIVMGVVLLGTTAILIPLWGMTGAAIAASVTFLLTNIIRVVEVWLLYHIQPYTWGLAKPVIAALSATAILIIVQKWVAPFPSIVIGASLGILYLSGLLLLGINQQDRLAIQSLVYRVKSIVWEA